ncbi:hypothetical protein L532_0972 [Bordetella bronchiseptica OSU095]|nr:hypothetical protein L507_0949 [Bordetella bronchiseptica CA90 BB02]KDD41325.1 hypothetical protein L532_0972 [Bordetella bronchiseptica OSU095]KDD49722.1 hypothetical protein L529_0962 [Bordetella bronchiseptica MBORD901]
MRIGKQGGRFKLQINMNECPFNLQNLQGQVNAPWLGILFFRGFCGGRY